ncbi:MAG: carboxypeptidase-like regulatory domain-containing protein, partial [Blastocatellia bacterium]
MKKEVLGSFRVAGRIAGRIAGFPGFAAMALSGLVCCFLAVPLHAQESRGAISGKVTDSTQAVVPNAAVRITNLAMGTVVSVTTNDTGLFRAPLLLPGTYQVAIEVAGFKKYVREGLVLRVNETL